MDDQTTLTCVSCRHCGSPLIIDSDIIVHRKPVLFSDVYAYPLEVLDVTCWCYSATNPGNNRFDLVLCTPVDTIQLHGEPTKDHSWFPEYAWNFAQCSICSTHMGWGFHLSDGTLEFVGLISTQFSLAEISITEYEYAMARASHAAVLWNQYQNERALALEMLPILPESLSTRVVHTLQAMDIHADLRAALPEILAYLRSHSCGEEADSPNEDLDCDS